MEYALLIIAMLFTDYAAYKLGESKKGLRIAYSKLWSKYKNLYQNHLKVNNECAIAILVSKTQKMVISKLEQDNQLLIKEKEHLKNGIIKCEVKTNE
jgi:hypothetical protein